MNEFHDNEVTARLERLGSLTPTPEATQKALERVRRTLIDVPADGLRLETKTMLSHLTAGVADKTPSAEKTRLVLGWAMGVAAVITVCALGWYASVRLGGPRSPIDLAASPDDGVKLVFAKGDGLTPRPLPNAEPVKPVAVGETLITRAGERRRVTLIDGSVLYLNENTQVKQLAGRHLDLLHGEVYVEVTPLPTDNVKRTFLVTTPKREVSALGTHFAVQAEKDETGVLVTQGKVQVTGISQPIEAGQQVTPGSQSIVPAARVSYLLDWTRELMASAGSPLVPANKRAGGALVAVDPSGQEVQLTLRKYVIDVHIEDGFARTTIDQTYFNNQWGRLEGTFYFPLPADATLSRLAMYVANGSMCDLKEGGMVERDLARNVYEEIRYTQRDPALLEWVDGTTFKMRVFPLEGRTEKRIILSYTQRLPELYGSTKYRFPAGHDMASVNDWSFHAVVKNGAKQRVTSGSHPNMTIEPKTGDIVANVSARNIKPNADVTLEIRRAEHRDSPDGARHSFSQYDHEGQRYLMLRYRPEFVSRNDKQRRDWVILFESSANRDPLLARAQIEVVRTLLENVEHDDTFSILTAGTRVRIFDKDARLATQTNIDRAIKFLEQTHLIGAMDLEHALRTAAPILTKAKNPHLVHIGSGVAAMGERREDVLARLIPDNVRYVGVGVGKRWSRSFMKQAADRTSGHFTQINPDEPITWRTFELLATLNTPRLLELAVSGDDARNGKQFLTETTSVAQGEELCAITRIGKDAPLPATITVTGKVNGKTFVKEIAVKDVAGNAGYLPRQWAKLEIDRLLAEDAVKNKQAIVDLSKASYVMSPYTSLLVLETEQDYVRFKVDHGRKDHWAMYECPEKIPTVYEPSQTVTTNEASRERQRPEEKRTVQQVLETILVRTPPRVLSTQPVYAGNAMTAWQYLSNQTPLDFSTNDFLRIQNVGANVRVLPDLNAMFSSNPAQLTLNNAAAVLANSGNTAFNGAPGTVTGTNFTYGANAYAPIAITNTGSYLGGNVLNAQVGTYTTLTAASTGGYTTVPTYAVQGTGYSPGNTLTVLGSAAQNSSVNVTSTNGSANSGTGTGYPAANDPFTPYYSFNNLAATSASLSFGQPQYGVSTPFIPIQGVKADGTGQIVGDMLILDGKIPPQINNFLARYQDPGVYLRTPVTKEKVSRLIERIEIMSRVFDFYEISEAGRRQQLEELKKSAFPRLTDDELKPVFDRFDPTFTINETQRETAMKRHPEIVEALTKLLKSRENLLPMPVSWANLLYQRPTFAHDNRLFYDLPMYAPGLSASESDILGVLEAEAALGQDVVIGQVDPAARALIDKARSLDWASVSLGDKKALTRLIFNGAGHYTVRRTLPSGLKEQVYCDGTSLVHLYPEIGLGGRRPVTRFHRADLVRTIPWLVLPAEDLARGADVKLIDGQTVAIVPTPGVRSTSPRGLGLEVHMVFGKDGRLRERQLVEMPAKKIVYRESYESLPSDLAEEKAPDLKPDVSQLVVLPMPQRTHAHLAGQVKDWDGKRYAHLDADLVIAMIAADCMAGIGAPPRAFEALTSRFHQADDVRAGRQSVGLLEATGENQAGDGRAGFAVLLTEGRTPNLRFGGSTSTPLERYLSRVNIDLTQWIPIFQGAPDGLLPRLAEYHYNYLLLSGSERHRAVDYLKKNPAPHYAWSIMTGLQQHGHDSAEFHRIAADVCQKLAEEPGLAYVGRYERVRDLFLAKDIDVARNEFRDLYIEVARTGAVPPIDADIVQRLQPEKFAELIRQTSAGWLKDKRFQSNLLLVSQLRQLGQPALADEVVTATEVEARKTFGEVAKQTDARGIGLELFCVNYLCQTEQWAKADALLQELLANDALVSRPELWRLGIVIANKRGLSARAFVCLEKALDLEFDHLPATVNLQTIRQEYGELLRKYEQLAESLTLMPTEPSRQDKFIAKVVRAADRWRSLDPEVTALCQQTAKILRTVGANDLCWDYLTTPIGMKPNESAPWLALAASLKQAGDFDLADRAYVQAFQAEPTNAQILWDRAQNLEQLRRTDDARRLYREIATGTWQPRFQTVQNMARGK